MSDLPPLMRDQRKVDAEQLRLLAIFHFVIAGIALIGVGFLFLHWALMHSMLSHPEAWNARPADAPPPGLFKMMRWFYAIAGTVIVTASAANAVSGWLIRRRRGRMFSLVVAALNCMAAPFGSVLGVFTLIVLVRDSVVELYEAKPRPA